MSLASCSGGPQAITHPDMFVEYPGEGMLVTSPLTITGKARGVWFSEATFPVQLTDANGNELAVGVAQAEDDWMTANYVQFSGTLEFQTTAKQGLLILRKDNPSGLPENDATVQVPVQFQ